MMKKSIYFVSMSLVLAFALIYVSVANAQNATTNASNATGNASTKANQTAGNASAGANKSASEFGTNASKGGGEVINKTEKNK